jgi:hypothetical protein
MSTCVVLLCDKAYFDKFVYTCNLLVTNGKYKGDICLVIGDDLHEDPVLLEHEIIKNNNVIIQYFPTIKFSEDILCIQKYINRPPHWFKKLFQYHKFHLFNTFFKKWDYIFYLDCGIIIFDDITPILNEIKPNTLLAHSDAYPTYQWKLHDQFDKTTDCFELLAEKYNLNIDYCQTTIMLYNTNIIEENTYNDLLNLLYEYPISIANDQGIIALYFTNIKPYFEQIKTRNETTCFYDYMRRNDEDKYIMLKTLG